MSAEEMKRGIRTAYADGAYTGAGQDARLVEFDHMIAAIEREAAARALTEAADEIFVRPPHIVDDDERESFDAGADAVYDALRARAAEIREGKSE